MSLFTWFVNSQYIVTGSPSPIGCVCLARMGYGIVAGSKSVMAVFGVVVLSPGSQLSKAQSALELSN